ncbi:phosphoglycolate phosphatase-like HAD superfamily hydrolase [Streptomyces sp. SPB162]|nr:phosphoglycolate phosphatase-like HAD superfamily hydrolase [Streptomyces sp. SPB162]
MTDPRAPIRSGVPEHGRVPKYYAVKTRLESVLDELGEGGLLPTERELAATFEVARETVRQALRELLIQGRVRRKGRGTVVVDALGWRDIADLTLCPADAGRGRPFPDLVLAALLRTGAADDVREIAVAGDTPYDMLCGRRSGAAVVAGVLTGAHDEPALCEAGATHVLATVAELPDVLAGLAGAGTRR